MTILHHTCPTTHGADIMPLDPNSRYQRMSLHVNMRVVIVSGSHAVEGRIVEVARPDYTHQRPAPIVTLDTGSSRITSSIHAGDFIAPPAGDNG